MMNTKSIIRLLISFVYIVCLFPMELFCRVPLHVIHNNIDFSYCTHQELLRLRDSTLTDMHRLKTLDVSSVYSIASILEERLLIIDQILECYPNQDDECDLFVMLVLLGVFAGASLFHYCYITL
jgi:hypothetical protein